MKRFLRKHWKLSKTLSQTQHLTLYGSFEKLNISLSMGRSMDRVLN
ncbi:hypothetical protein ACO1KB_13155 [Leptospira interrogans serovar Szwajizak]|nr:hypothetical protein [Leptospira interrogans]